MAAAASTIQPSSPSDVKPEPAKQLYVRYVEYTCNVVAGVYVQYSGVYVCVCVVRNIVTHTGVLVCMHVHLHCTVNFAWLY